MFKKIVLASILISLFPTLTSAQPLFGPQRYTRTIGKPNTYQDRFQACNTNATYKLVVENGEGGKDRLSSASVILNGQEVIRENELNQRIDKVEKIITIESENRIDVRLSSGPGGFINASVYCVSGCLEVKVTSPSDNSTINRSKAIIQGSLSNEYGETGIAIQWSEAGGQWSGIAETQGNSFAGISPLQQGQNTITATATDACGYQAHDTITINTDSVQEQIRLTANPQSGIPDATGTFSTTLEADANLPNSIYSYSWDTNGDGSEEQIGKDLSKITANYQAPGLYFPKVAITDSQNSTYTETAIVNVLSKEQMDALIKSKWEGMKVSLINSKIDNALKNFVGGQNSKYKQVFEALKDQLTEIFAAEEEFSFVSAYENRIEYENIVVEGDKVIFVRNAVPMREFCKTTSERFARPPSTVNELPIAGKGG